MKLTPYLAAFIVAMTACVVNAQDFSNKGKEFWLCFPNHVPSGGNLARMALFITSDKNSSGTISVNGFNTNFTVTANQVTGPIDIPYSSAHITTSETGVVINKGISVKVNSGQPAVVVYAHIYAAARSAASLILPVTALGRKYYSTNYWQASTGGSQSQFQVIAAESNTTVRIQRRRNGVLDPTVTTVTLLNPGDLVQIQDPQDLTGTIIESVSSSAGGCKRIAVFSGSSALSIGRPGCSGGSFDPLFQQLYPTNTWGKNFGVINFSNNPNGYHLRVLAAENGTNVNIGGTMITLNAGEYYPASTPNQNPYINPMSVTADKPVSVAQYMMSANCANTNTQANQGDPDMVILNPIEQNINDISIFSSNLQVINTKFLTVYMPTAAASSFRINSTPPSGSFVPMVPNNGYSYLVEDLTNSSSTSFRLTADSGFNAIAYGLGDFETYAYSAGTNVRDLYQYVSLENQYATVDYASTCKNTPFYFSMTFPYQPTQIQWQFSGLFPDITIDAPVPDSTWVINGRQLYRYKLKNVFSVVNAGTFPIKVLAQNPSPDGCSGIQEISYDLQVIERPKADFSITTNNCQPDSVKFFDKATTEGRPIIKWTWQFGDGQTAAVSNPVHLYQTAGNFTVSYSSITDMGCLTDTVTKPIVINAAPVAKFTSPYPYCAGRALIFTDASTSDGSVVNKWTWNFGDGTSDVVTTSNTAQSHTFNNSGAYDVTLKVENSAGCSSTLYSQQVAVTSTPIADFILPENCLDDPFVQFTNTSSINDGTEAGFSYQWNFGDPNANAGNPNTSVQQNPVHRYSEARNYDVSLTVTSNKNCVTSISKVFTINGSEPKSVFTVQGGTDLCSNRNVTILNQSTVDFGALSRLEIFWDYASDPTNKTVDQDPLPNKSYSFTYPEFFTPLTKSFTVRVVAYSGDNCLHESSQTITLNASPQIDFSSLDPVCSDVAPFTFNKALVINGITGTGSYSGPGTTPSGIFNPATAREGVHTIRYTFTSDKGCISTADKNITVYQAATAKAGPDRLVLEGGNVVILGGGTGPNLSYLWSPSTFLNNPNIATPIAAPTGDFTYTLRVTTEDGCSATDQVFVKVLMMPVVPNVFTPNGDGINDTWIINALESYPGCTVQVYNRYGKLVYESIGYSRPWDGKSKGLDLPAGTYYYIINPKNGRRQMSGFVDIVR